MAISASGEGCHKQMEGYLAQIMDGVMNFVNDPVRELFINSVILNIMIMFCLTFSTHVSDLHAATPLAKCRLISRPSSRRSFTIR